MSKPKNIKRKNMVFDMDDPEQAAAYYELNSKKNAAVWISNMMKELKTRPEYATRTDIERAKRDIIREISKVSVIKDNHGPNMMIATSPEVDISSLDDF